MSSGTPGLELVRKLDKLGGWGYIKDHPVEKWYRDAQSYTIFEGTSEIHRIVISHELGAADAALALRDRVPQPIMQLAMKVLRPPRK